MFYWTHKGVFISEAALSLYSNMKSGRASRVITLDVAIGLLPFHSGLQFLFFDTKFSLRSKINFYCID